MPRHCLSLVISVSLPSTELGHCIAVIKISSYTLVYQLEIAITSSEMVSIVVIFLISVFLRIVVLFAHLLKPEIKSYYYSCRRHTGIWRGLLLTQGCFTRIA